MDIEKTVNSKIFNIFDWLFRLLVLNILTLVISIGIVTILPAFSACLQTIKRSFESKSQNIFKLFFQNFIINFKLNFFIGLLLITFSALAIFGFLSYGTAVGLFPNEITEQEEFIWDIWGVMAVVGLSISMIFLFFLICLFIQLPLVVNYFKFRFLDNFKFAIYVILRNFAYIIICVIVWIVSIILLFSGSLFFAGLWSLYGLSVPVFVTYIIFKNKYWYLINIGSTKIKDIEEDEKIELEGNENDKIGH